MAKLEFAYDNPDAIKFHVPFGWGALRVTHDAAADYALTSLRENTLDGDMPDAKQTPSGPHTIITLAGVSEITSASPELGSTNYPGQDGLESIHFASIDTRKSMIKIHAGFFETAEQATQKANAEGGFAELDDVPVSKQNMSQVMSHTLAEQLGEVMTNAYFELAQGETARRSRVKTVTSSAIWSSMVAALAAPNLLSGQPTVTGYATLALVSILGINAHGKTSQIIQKDHLRKISTIQPRAIVYAGIVAEDVHTTFCSKVFNRKMESLFHHE